MVEHTSLTSLAVLNTAEVVDSRGVLLPVRELAGLEVERGVAALAKSEEVDKSEAGLGKEVKNTIEDHLTIGRDNVTAVCETPSDGVKGPEEGEHTGGDEVSLLELGAEVGSRLETGTVDDPEDVEHGNATHCVVTPLVVRDDEGTNETGDDHNKVEEDGDEDGGEGKTGNEEDFEKKEGSGDGPVDVTSVPDLTGGVKAVDEVTVVVAELDTDGGGTKVGSEREVGNRGSGQDGSREVVEGTLTTVDLERPDHGTETGRSHDGEDGPEEIGTMLGDVDVGIRGVDSDSLVTSSLDELEGVGGAEHLERKLSKFDVIG